MSLLLGSGNPSQPGHKDFLKYFMEHYAGRDERPLTYRKDGVNTNMHLERMQRMLKHTVPERKENKRVDKLMFAFVDLMHHYLMQRIVYIVKNKKTSKMARIEKKPPPTKANTKFITSNEDGAWSVKSQSTTGLSDTVAKEADGPCCHLVCRKCAI